MGCGTLAWYRRLLGTREAKKVWDEGPVGRKRPIATRGPDSQKSNLKKAVHSANCPPIAPVSRVMRLLLGEPISTEVTGVAMSPCLG